MKDYYYLTIDKHMKRVTNLSKTAKKSHIIFTFILDL